MLSDITFYLLLVQHDMVPRMLIVTKTKTYNIVKT